MGKKFIAISKMIMVAFVVEFLITVVMSAGKKEEDVVSMPGFFGGLFTATMVILAIDCVVALVLEIIKGDKLLFLQKLGIIWACIFAFKIGGDVLEKQPVEIVSSLIIATAGALIVKAIEYVWSKERMREFQKEEM